MHRQILYFSVLQQHRDDFKKKIRPFENAYDFKIIDEGSFSHASDLLLFLEEEKYHNILRRLYIVVDYLPFYGDGYNYEDEADAIRRAIIGFPEIYFLFDETYGECKNFILFLFNNRIISKKRAKDYLAMQYHCFNMNFNPPKGLCALANQQSNLFDGTNLRYCVKAALYDSLEAHQNFKRIQTSRSKNLAICVEEERTQNRFESFALYANGFRVWPIMSAIELMDFNSRSDLQQTGIKIVVRDYDLQFPDANVEEHPELIIKGKKNDENLVDYIRGAKYLESEKKWRALDNEKRNHFWYNLREFPKFFISKGVNNFCIVTSEEKYREERNDENNNPETLSMFQDRVSSQVLRGMSKPVTGIYCSFQNFEIIKERYDEDVRWEKVKQKVEKIKNQIKRLEEIPVVFIDNKSYAKMDFAKRLQSILITQKSLNITLNTDVQLDELIKIEGVSIDKQIIIVTINDQAKSKAEELGYKFTPKSYSLELNDDKILDKLREIEKLHIDDRDHTVTFTDSQAKSEAEKLGCKFTPKSYSVALDASKNLGMLKKIENLHIERQFLSITFNDSIERRKCLDQLIKIKNVYFDIDTIKESLIYQTKDYYIQTSRKEHHHGVPLDIYDLIKGMIDRARLYQEKGKYVFSAMVAQEALEILNGFHESLMLKAYHIYAVSENAICMNLLGGYEYWLEKDAFFRVNKIQHDLKRMLARTDENVDRKSLNANILNQIFSDCRQFCKKKEHFSSEAVFIGAMSHLNEGYELPEIFEEIKNIIEKFGNELRSFRVLVRKYKREKKDGEQTKA